MHTKSPTNTCLAKDIAFRSLWSFGFSFSLSLVHNYVNVQIALGLMTVITQAVVGGKGVDRGVPLVYQFIEDLGNLIRVLSVVFINLFKQLESDKTVCKLDSL